MSKRMWLAAMMAGFLMAVPVALMLVNLNIFAHRSWVADDLTWAMVFAGMGMVGLGGLISAPLPLRALVSVARG